MAQVFTTTAIYGTGPFKGRGWCKENKVAHAYEAGGTLTCNPPIQTRICMNCGHTQWLRQPQWEDRDDE